MRADSRSDRRILIVGIDGLRLDQARIPGVAPVLSRLLGQGRLSHMTMELPTMSGPGWSTLLTGTRIAEHGVTGNSFIGHRLHSHPDVLSRAFHRDTSARTFAAAGWPPLVSPAGLGPVIHERREQQRAGLHHVFARDGETFGYTTVDAEIAAVSCAHLTQHHVDLGFVYFCGADEAGHLHGAMSEEYREAISRVDAHLGGLIAVIEERADAGEDWLVLTLTDHGHRPEGGHGGDSAEERASFLLAWSPEQSFLPAWPEQIQPWEVMDLVLEHRHPPHRQ